MKTMTASAARANLYSLLNEGVQYEPIKVTGKKGNAVLVSEDDWRAIEETLYLISIPGMRASLLKPIDESEWIAEEDVDW